METNSNIKDRAWHLLWKRKWLLKTLGVTLLLTSAAQAIMLVFRLITAAFDCPSVHSLQANLAEGESLLQLSGETILAMIPLFLMEMFLGFIVSGIVSYGCGVISNAAADDRAHGWMGASFAGFKDPLGLACLSFRIWLIFVGWSILALIPASCIMYFALPFLRNLSLRFSGADLAVFTLLFTLAASVFIAVVCLPFYRYRYLFRIKADNPGWTAGECLKRASFLSDGFKWRMFVLDCTYWRIMLLPLALFAALAGVAFWMFSYALDPAFGAGGGGAEALTPYEYAGGMFCILLLFMVLFAACVITQVIVFAYNGIGQTLLYRQISARKDSDDQQG